MAAAPLDTGFAYVASFAAHFIGAALSLGACLWVAKFGGRERPDRFAALIACLVTGVWCALATLNGAADMSTALAASIRNFAYIYLIFKMFAADGRDESVRPIRPVLITLALVELLQPLLLLIDARIGVMPELVALTFEVSIVLSMLFAVGALMLLHNLYAGAAAASREILRWSTIALTGIFAFDLNLFTIAYLGGEYPAVLTALRGSFTGIMVCLIAMSANATSAALQFRPSRAVTFQTLSLLVIGSYLLLMVLVPRSLALLGGDIAPASQIVFLVFAVVIAVIWLPSQRLRGWLRVTATKHLFQHR